jgi:hypothetical protein
LKVKPGTAGKESEKNARGPASDVSFQLLAAPLRESVDDDDGGRSIVENPACSAEQGSLGGMGLDNYVNWGEERTSQRRGIRNSTLGQNLGDWRVIFSCSPTAERIQGVEAS